MLILGIGLRILIFGIAMRKRKWKKWSAVAAGSAAFLVVLAVILWFAVLPPYLEKRIRAALMEVGFPEASIEIERISWSGAILRDLVLGPKYGFQAGEIRVMYSLASLLRSRVHGIVLDGLDIDIALHDRKVDIGPLADLHIDGGREESVPARAVLPFDRLELQNSRLNIDWEGRELRVPFEASVHRLAQDSVSVHLNGSIDNAPLSAGAAVHMESLSGTGDVEINELSAKLLGELAEAYLRSRPNRYSGRLNIDGKLTSRDGKWLAEVTMAGDGLQVEVSVDSAGRMLALSDLEAGVAYVHPDSAMIRTKAMLNGIPLNLEGSIDPRSLSGKFRFHSGDITGERLSNLITLYMKEPAIALKGKTAITGKATAQEGNLRSDVTVDGKNLTMQVSAPGHHLVFTRPLVKAGIQLAYDGAHVHDAAAHIKMSRMAVTDTVMDMTVQELVFDAPLSLDKKTVEKGTFTLREVHGNRLKIPKIAGSFSLSKERAGFKMSGNVFPGAEVEASGRFALGGKKPSGELDVRVPPFSLENSVEFTELFPELMDCEIGGTIEADAHIDYKGGQVVPLIKINIADASWRKRKADASIEGITGTFTFNSFAPPATAGPQRLRWSKMGFGNFATTDGTLQILIDGGDSTFVGSIESSWLDGRLWSDSIAVMPKNSMISCDLHVEGLNLQGILDFLKYDGVKGDGKIEGNLPVTVAWAKRKRVRFGDGILRANPQSGRLQLSKKTAMMFLGLTHDIDPETAQQHDMAKLLMLRALQDMEYTLLELDFTDDEELGWITRVQIKGHGPYGDKANRIPIGGIDIEINNLDDLLNSVILPGYQSRKLKLGGS